MLNYEILAVSHTLHLTPPPLPNTVLSTPLTRTRVGRFLIQIHQVTRELDFFNYLNKIYSSFCKQLGGRIITNMFQVFSISTC